MNESTSNVVTLHASSGRPNCDATESLRLLNAFVKLSPARRAALVEALEAEAINLLPADPR